MRRARMAAAIMAVPAAASIACGAGAQSCGSQPATLSAAGGFRILNGGPAVTIPLEIVNNHIRLPVSIEGVTLRVTLDTGMPYDGIVLFSNPRVDGIPFKNPQPAPPEAGCGNAPQQVAVAGVTLQLPGLELPNQTVSIISLGPTGLGADLRDHDGIIGLALLGRFVVGIDFEARTLTCIDPQAFRSEGLGERLALRFVAGSFIETDTEVTLEDGTTIPLQVIVDTGNSHYLLLNIDSREGIRPPQKTLGVMMKSLMGDLTAPMGRVRAVRIGPYELRDPLVVFKGDDAVARCPMEKHGNLGTGLLRRFHVTFDYSRSQMFLRPNATFSQPFDYPMTGIVPAPVAQGSLKVMRVIPDSPAADARLQAGDEVVTINHRPVGDYTWDERGALLTREGTDVALDVQRDGRRFAVVLKLRRLI